jgi:hypothetical protein
MKTNKVVETEEYAYELLKGSQGHWKDRRSVKSDAMTMDQLMVCPTIPGSETVERNGVKLVDVDGELVPRLGGINYKSCNYHHIYDDEKGEQLIARAVIGDEIAHRVLCSVAARFVAGGCNMPKRLRDYVAELLTRQSQQAPQRRRGRDPYANYVRDFYITSAVLQLCRLGLKPTRNRATERESACSIVSRALERLQVELAEPAVEKIWERFSRKFPFSGPSRS